MIEAVNSVLSNSSASRTAVEQTSTVRSTAANPQRIQEAAQAPFVSPAISIDRQSSRAIIQIRDSDTGDVVRQFPTEGQLKAYRQAQEFSDRQKAQADNELREANGASSQGTASAEVPVAADVVAPAASAASAPVETEA